MYSTFLLAIVLQLLRNQSSVLETQNGLETSKVIVIITTLLFRIGECNFSTLGCVRAFQYQDSQFSIFDFKNQTKTHSNYEF